MNRPTFSMNAQELQGLIENGMRELLILKDIVNEHNQISEEDERAMECISMKVVTNALWYHRSSR